MAINVRKVGPTEFIWSCTKCGTTGSGTDEFSARKKGAAHDREEH